MTEEKSTKKVVKKMVTVKGQEAKIPIYLCPPGMSGQGLDLERHFAQEEKEEAIFEVPNDTEVLEQTLKEDCGFTRDYQRYLDEGEIISAEVEDYVGAKYVSKFYDADFERNADLVTIFNR